MPTIGMISDSRLHHIPALHRSQHEFCFWLVDQMLLILRESELLRISAVEILFESQEEGQSFQNAPDIFDWLAENGYEAARNTIVQNQTSLALYGDAIGFLHAALKALEKRQFTVAFSLMRKPLNENLMMVSWLLADPNEFSLAMAQADNKVMSSTIPSDKSLPILQAAASAFQGNWPVNAALLHEQLFVRTNEHSLMRLFDKATHLTTSFKAYRTEPLNLNFVFKDSRDNDVFPAIYPKLAHALLFMLAVQLSLYDRMEKASSSTIKWLQAASTGTYHSLFLQGQSNIARRINKHGQDSLTCLACRCRVKVTKHMLPRLLIGELLDCPECGAASQFPFHWLMATDNDDEDA